ncbi:MAG: SGNH/GDSL hydrolase family protein, partial [Halioglobus sp.]|nr:SGNH/GDSL hydrolase family protein [Halioglobus sp.]
MKNAFLGLLSIVIAFMFLAILGEAVLRVNHVAKEALTGNTILKFELEEELGWVGTRDYAYSGELRDAAQQVYRVDITANENGFRAFGDPLHSQRRKVLFLGDSFTHALQVSDDKTYFSLLADRLDLEVFALGVDGYGTLQQFLMLDRYVDRIKPDAIVLQLCPNDFVNNHYQVELQSPRNNNGMRRPYWIDGAVQYRLPRAMPWLRHFANAHSRLLYFILTRLDRLSFKSG